MTFTEQLIIVLIPILLPPIISLSVLMYQHLLQHVPDKQRQVVQQVVNTVVPAVEQIAAKELLNSPAKKQKALEMATEMLHNLHINVSQEALSAMIEATVYALNQQQGKDAAPAAPKPAAQPVLVGAAQPAVAAAAG
jgi:Bacteriophage holin of superfamily 6 (Holin_LLH)